MGDTEVKRSLRLVTYLVPGLPLALYQTYQQYLEEVLGIPIYLMVESRWSGPPLSRTDPFTTNDADLGFMCSTAYMSLSDKDAVEFLPVAPIHIHPHTDLQPVYFSDVIIHSDNRERFQDFSDLQGCQWGYNDEISLSGNIITLKHLKKINQDLSFFGNVTETGSHHNSIEQVMSKEIHAAAIDCNTLSNYLLEHPDHRSALHVLCSWGPQPIQPLVINSRLPEKLKHQISDALLQMNHNPKWKQKLARFHVWGFKRNPQEALEKEHVLKELVARVSEETNSRKSSTVLIEKDNSIMYN